MKKELREKIYNKYDGHCAYCGRKIKYKDMQVDHLIPQVFLEGGDFHKQWVQSFDNYMPSCRQCNHYKSDCLLETFRKNITTIPIKLHRDSYIYRIGQLYGFYPEEEEQKVEFYFEKVDKDAKLFYDNWLAGKR